MIANIVIATSLALNVTVSMAEQSARQSLLPIERNVIDATNAQRTRRGLRPLKLDLRLVRSARRHAAWMTRSRSLRHTSAPVAENIAMGQPHSGAAVQAWMNSSGHRANMLNGRYRRVGAAAYSTASGTIYWCIQFLR